MSDTEIVVFDAGDREFTFPIDGERETIWASQAQIQELFGIDQSGVSRHVRNVFADEEVDPESNMQKVHIASSDRPVTLYSLDVILAVGYRANSGRAITFRRWASGVLKQYLLEGAALNERRLEQLGSIVQILARSSDELVAGVADVLAKYLPGLRTLRDYDEGHLEPGPGDQPRWRLTYDEARTVIDRVGAEFPDDHLFGGERGGSFRGVIEAIYQGFGGHDLYPTVQEKAANLLYLVVKDHPLSDGNKRSAAALFVHFLANNRALHDERGRPRITNNALAAITLMVAMSDPKEKDLMIALLMRMLTEDAA
ncbi:virulence protein RhuM/Fic/DOC family protein [Agromyces binzhouensis]|uniref:Fic/DOC family protein n=1 Tax=Agromyces binzhouensis TaxID=1817495 RepID=A0A4Q2JS35_9MICO|nr:virulence protein RhuM/Fic/DOC family protein [Agromyces binzhouensis]RXZ50014.1 Fic/DOC family protein [Agromyces binzhouensis]